MNQQPNHDQSLNSEVQLDSTLELSGLAPQKKELYDTFVDTLKTVLPHLGTDESKIVSSLIILALKLEGLIGKEISEEDSKLIQILKETISKNTTQKEAAIELANILRKQHNE